MFAAWSDGGQAFDPKPMMLAYQRDSGAAYFEAPNGKMVVDVGDQDYLTYYDVLGNVMWGVLAAQWVPLWDDAIVTIQERVGGVDDDGDRLMVRLGLSLYDTYGDDLTLGQVMQGIRDAIPQLIAQSHGKLNGDNLQTNKIIKRTEVGYA